MCLPNNLGKIVLTGSWLIQNGLAPARELFGDDVITRVVTPRSDERT